MNTRHTRVSQYLLSRSALLSYVDPSKHCYSNKPDPSELITMILGSISVLNFETNTCEEDVAKNINRRVLENRRGNTEEGTNEQHAGYWSGWWPQNAMDRWDSTAARMHVGTQKRLEEALDSYVCKRLYILFKTEQFYVKLPIYVIFLILATTL